jgi:hypothetical protein
MSRHPAQRVNVLVVSGVSYSLWCRALAAHYDDSMDIRDAIPSSDDENVSSDTLLLCAAKFL